MRNPAMMGAMRLPSLSPAELDDDQRDLYDAITSGSRSTGPQLFRLTGDDGALAGPFNAMLLNPPIGDALQRLGAALRYSGRLTARCREIAILAVAAYWDCGFEQRAHEAVGAHVGLTDAELTALRAGADPRLSDPTEAAVLSAVRSLLEHDDLDDESYAAAVSVIGADGLFELTTLVGYYGLLAAQLRVFRVP